MLKEMASGNSLENGQARYTALITGGTSGFGLALAKELLRTDARAWNVVIASRNLAAGNQIAAELNAAFGRSRAAFVNLDLGSFPSIRAVKHLILPLTASVDALVLNAGVQFRHGNAKTSEDMEATFGINHLGHFLLFHELLPLLSEAACIVPISSGTHDPSLKSGIEPPRFVDPVNLAFLERDPESSFKGNDRDTIIGERCYSTSKLCNVFFGYEIYRRIQSGSLGQLKQELAHVIVYDPGLMPGTGLARDYPPAARFIWKSVLPKFPALAKRLFGESTTSADSAKVLSLVMNESAKAQRELIYISKGRVSKSSEESYDLEEADLLWRRSLELSGITQ